MTADTPPEQTAEVSLTFLAPAPTFPPKREHWFVCDDIDGRLISRFSSAPFVGAPQKLHLHHGLDPMAPGLAKPRFDPLFSVK